MDNKAFSSILLKWYAANKRQLPWRGDPDPYAVWISEAMLQQTRVDTVIPYYLRWMGRFPSVTSLANASEEDVLNAWEGLGYYSRARNLRKAARLVCEKFQGNLPQSECRNYAHCRASVNIPPRLLPQSPTGKTRP